MADHTILAAAVGKHNVTLTPDTVDNFTFAKDPDAIAVLSNGAEELYFTVDGTEPTIGGTHCWKMLAVPGERRVVHNRPSAPVKVISEGAPEISVTRG